MDGAETAVPEPVVRLDRDGPPAARPWAWPSGALRRLRYVVALVVAGWILLLVVNAAAADRSLLITAACGVGLVAAVVRMHVRDRLSWTDMAAQLLLFAGAHLTDGASQVGGGMVAMFLLLTGIYGRLAQCVVQVAGSTVIAAGAVLAKQQAGVPTALGVGDTLQNAVAPAVLCALTFAVASVISRYELLVARDSTALRAGAALVAAQTRDHVYASVWQAASSLIRTPGDRAFVARHDGDVLRVLVPGGGGEVAVAQLPPFVAAALAGPLRPYGRVAATPGGGDGVLVPLGEDDGRPVLLVVLTRDPVLKHAITGLRALEPAIQLALRNLELTEGLRRQAFQDSLTGLANRAAFHHRLPLALRDRPGAPARVALLLLDLDGFKAVNDRFGHAAGDQLLVETARRLLGCVRAGDLVGRLGGDEFVILLDDVDDDDRAVVVAERVLGAVTAGVAALGFDVAVSTSVGIAFGRPGETTGDRLTAEADAAMYRAKASGKGRYCVQPAAVGS